jgi:hypothetical protein
MRRHRLEMERLLRNLVVVMMLGIVSVGAFAQKPGKGQDKRPVKEQVRVTDRKDNPPPRNTNQPKPDKKKRP